APGAGPEPPAVERRADPREAGLADPRPRLVALRALDEPIAELVVDGVEHDDSARRSAPLPGIGESRGERPLDCAFELRVVAHDERVLAAELERHLRQPGGRALVDPAPRLRRAREAHEIHLR